MREAATLIEQAQPIIITLISRMMPTINADDADDLQQDINVHLLERIQRFDSSRSKFTTFAWSVARNFIVDTMRKRRQPMQDIDVDEQPAPDPDDIAGAIYPTPDITKLTDRQRTVFDMYASGMNGTTIARKLGIHADTVRQMKQRIVRVLNPAALTPAA